MSGRAEPRVLRATLLVSGAHYGTLAVTIFTQLLFARLLAAADIGAYAIAFGATEIGGALLDVSLNRAVIARFGSVADPVDRKAEMGTAWALVLVQTALFLLLATLAWGVSVIGYPIVDGSIPKLMALLLLAKGLSKPGFMAAALAEHEIRYEKLSAITLAGAVLGAGAGLVAARLGAGASAICLRDALSTVVVSAVTIWVYRSHVQLLWVKERAIAILQYSGRLMLSGLTDRLINQMDTLLLGRVLDLAGVGVYSYARRLVGLAINACLPAIQKVLFAAYAGQREPTKSTRLHVRASRWIVVLGAGATVVTAVFPGEIVRVTLGATFADAARPLAWLAPLLAISLVSENDRALLVARGKFRVLIAVRYAQCVFVAGGVALLTTVPTVALTGVCAVVVIGEFLSLVATRALVLKRIVADFDKIVLAASGAASGAAWILAALRMSQMPILHRALLFLGLPMVTGLLGWAYVAKSKERAA